MSVKRLNFSAKWPRRGVRAAVGIVAIVALGTHAALASGTVRVLYAGSLVNLMEHDIGPAFEKASGDGFAGYAGGSNKLANEIKGKLRQGDVFVSANPKVDDSLMGPANGDWVNWYIAFAQSPLVIGYNPQGRFAADFKTKPWYEVLQEPGIRVGRTDPKLDPKGRLTVELMEKAETAYHLPGLAHKVLGDDENSAQVLPEEELVGRLQSGQVDVGFLYSTETADAHIPTITLPPAITPKATYTVTVLKDAPNAAGAEAFTSYLLGPSGEDVLKAHGLSVIRPTLSGRADDVPSDLRKRLATDK